jgi:nicotinate-nucleotide pyrophosphorylase (carboxylating)
MFKPSKTTHDLICAALREDIGLRDITTEALIPSDLKGEAHIDIKKAGILCGGPVISELFRILDPGIEVVAKVRDGEKARAGQKVFVLRGRIRSILKGERVALNFLGFLSGVATLTNNFVKRVRGSGAKILDTRKTTPLWRELEKYAVRTGGGTNHRFGLWDEVLVKDNHWLAIRKLLKEHTHTYFYKQLRVAFDGKKIPIHVEVESVEELKELLTNGHAPTCVLLDNFSLNGLKQAVKIARKSHPKLLLEASGGVNLSNVHQIAKAGVDRISIGALTHSSSFLDFSLHIAHIFASKKNK